MSKKIVVILRGGMGNQLFSYAAARRLSIKNDAELVLDTKTGFSRDWQYRRKYSLERFSIPARLATASERLEPFQRYRHALARWRAYSQPYEKQNYIKQSEDHYDPRLIDKKIMGTTYLDGLWQSENYFSDITKTIKRDLRIVAPSDIANQELANKIESKRNSVALHVRWFAAASAPCHKHNVKWSYYNSAIRHINEGLVDAHYFVFSDEPEAVKERLSIPKGNYTLVSNNNTDDCAYADLWLMSMCRHFVLANSTFSWWGAWLGEAGNSTIVAPKPEGFDMNHSWRIDGLLPERWTRV